MILIREVVILLNLLSIFYPATAFGLSLEKRDHVEVHLVTSSKSTTGYNVGVHYKIDPEWHIYWHNPGDSGAAPKFEVEGGQLRQIGWPYPKRLPIGRLTNYGYENDVVLFLDIAAKGGPLKLELEWLVCKVECIPGFATFEFNLEELPIENALFEKYLNRIPRVSEQWQARVLRLDDHVLELNLQNRLDGLEEIKNLHIFPEDRQLFERAPPTIETNQSSVQITLPRSPNGIIKSPDSWFAFVVENTDGSVQSFRTNVPLNTYSEISWLLGLLFAFVGGLILNLMPCVFPVLFLKAYGYLKETDHRVIRRSAWAYFFGVMVSFFVVGCLLMILRVSGASIGWGYQLQNAGFIYALALLFFLMALNFYGFFEFGSNLTTAAGKLYKCPLLSGSFGTGVLAVVVATPCTAPFMGSALGLTLLLPALQSLLIYLTLGFGMALPMLLIGYFPRLIEMLPRSGNWMVIIKQLLSLPLLLTALWLLWVLAQQKSPTVVFVVQGILIVVFFSIWWLQAAKRAWAKQLAVLLLVASMVFGFIFVVCSDLSQPTNQTSSWNSYQPKIIEQKLGKERVFIDFTASWCITCQVNKQTVLDTKEIQALFRQHEVYLVRADWTNHNPEITTALAAHGRNSVPFYLFYNHNGDVKTLPEILTKNTVKELFEGEKQ